MSKINTNAIATAIATADKAFGEASATFASAAEAALVSNGARNFTLGIQKAIVAVWCAADTSDKKLAAAARQRIKRVRAALAVKGWKLLQAGKRAISGHGQIELDARGGSRGTKARDDGTETDQEGDSAVSDKPTTTKHVLNDAAVLARMGELATAFLVAEDRAIMSRLLAAINHKLKPATVSKK